MLINIHDAKTHFSRYLQQAMQGEEIIIAKNGMPLVKLVPVQEQTPARTAGLSTGSMNISPDFDAPLPEDILEGFER